MKKNKIKKLITKHLANFDNRLYDLELHTGTVKPLFEPDGPPTQVLVRVFEVVNIEEPTVKQDLPEKWQMRVTVSNLEAVTDWLGHGPELGDYVTDGNMSINFKATDIPEITTEEFKKHVHDINVVNIDQLPEKWCVKVSAINEDLLKKWINLKYVNPSFIYCNKAHSCGEVKSVGYTEISTEDFKRLVLKETGHDTSVATKLEAGNWHKSEFGLVFIVKIEESNLRVYGFNKGQWFDECNSYNYNLTPASKSEVSVALIAEAKKRGFKPGVKISRADINKCYNSNTDSLQEIVVIDITSFPIDTTWHYNINNNYLEHHGFVIFDNGQWAGIISEAEKEIDWSVPGQLVSFDEIVCVTSGETLQPDLSGIKVFSGLNVLSKEFRNDWICDNFHSFKGRLIRKES